MGVRRRGGTWHYQFELAGILHSGSTGLKDTERNRNAAMRCEADKRRLARDGQIQRLVPAPLASAASQFIQWAQGEYAAHPNSWKRLRGSMTSLVAHLGSTPVHAIRAGHLENFKSWRRSEGMREVTIRHDLHALSVLLRYARKHGWCGPADPLTDVEIPSDRDAVRIHVLSQAEIDAYLDAADSDLRDIATLMLLQGPRPAEVMAARAEDLCLDRSEWRIPRSKSAAGRRTLHLLPRSAAILAERPAGWLFPAASRTGHLMNIQKKHAAALEATGLAFVLYDFRHTFATRMAQAGCDIATLAAILGHANLRTVQRYIHIGEDHKRAAMAQYGGR